MQSSDVLVAITDQIKVGLHRAEKMDTDMQSSYVLAMFSDFPTDY